MQTPIRGHLNQNRDICSQVDKNCHSESPYFKFRVLQPLFRALMTIVCSERYENEDSGAVGRIPVLLVRMGVEDKLSAPITFESIAGRINGTPKQDGRAVETTLETAVDFVTSLDAREAAAFGLPPDPVASWEASSPRVSDW